VDQAAHDDAAVQQETKRITKLNKRRWCTSLGPSHAVWHDGESHEDEKSPRLDSTWHPHDESDGQTA